MHWDPEEIFFHSIFSTPLKYLATVSSGAIPFVFFIEKYRGLEEALYSILFYPFLITTWAVDSGFWILISLPLFCYLTFQIFRFILTERPVNELIGVY